MMAPSQAVSSPQVSMKGRRVAEPAWIFAATTFTVAPTTTSVIGRSKAGLTVFSSNVDGSTSNGRVMVGSDSTVRSADEGFYYNVFGEQQAATTSPAVAAARTLIVTTSATAVAETSTMLAVVMAWMEEEEDEKGKVKGFPLSDQVGLF